MRHRQLLTRDNALLLVIDFQEKLLAAFPESQGLLKNCVKMVSFAKVLSLPILWTEQYPKGLGRTMKLIADELLGFDPIEKLSFSCFGEPAFANRLAEYPSVDQILVCGIETHICVEQTALDGIEAGYQMHIMSDTCGARKPGDHEIGLRKMEQAGAILSSSEMAMYEILSRSDAREFRAVLALVK
ncbi:MAG: hydrolase [Candidatus Abyssubacteria bacterium]